MNHNNTVIFCSSFNLNHRSSISRMLQQSGHKCERLVHLKITKLQNLFLIVKFSLSRWGSSLSYVHMCWNPVTHPLIPKIISEIVQLQFLPFHTILNTFWFSQKKIKKWGEWPLCSACKAQGQCTYFDLLCVQVSDAIKKKLRELSQPQESLCP